MFTALVDGIRNETAVGVPRRFSIGTLFVLLTLYGVLFRLLVLLGADTVWTALICLFFSAVTIAQVALFHGVRPRAASIVAGGVACPALLLVLLADEYATQWSGWEPSNIGDFGPMAYFTVLLLLAMVGLGLGYLVGCASAGVFYVIGKILPNTNILGVETTVETPSEKRIVEWLLTGGRWLSPVQPSNPLRGALVHVLFYTTFGFLLSPFVTWLAPHHVVMIGLALGVCLAVLSGNFQLWIFWPVTLLALGVLASTWSANELRQIPFYQLSFQRSPQGLPSTLHVLGGLFGLTFSAAAGWTQWALLRNKEQRSFGWRAYGVAIVLFVATSFLISNRLGAWSQSPTQQLFRRVIDNGGAVYWDSWSSISQKIRGVRLQQNSTEEEFLQLRPLISNPHSVELFGANFSDLSVKEMDGLSLQSLGLSMTSITDNAFGGVTDLSASYVYLNGTKLGDRGLASLISIPEMQNAVGCLILDETPISDAGILHLQPCKALTYVSLRKCSITDEGLANLATIRSLTDVNLNGCPISDEGLKALASMPNLARLYLENTNITDRGLAYLAKSKSLTHLNLDATLVRTAKLSPKWTIRWNDPDEQQD